VSRQETAAGETTGNRIQIRQDLERSEQRHQGANVLVVKDPVTRRYFRFTEAQAVIITLMDEPTDAETLAAAVSERLGQKVSPATITAFFGSLEKKLLVDTPRVRETLENVDPQKRNERNMLYWKLASFDPERVFAWLIPRTRWAFRPAFHVVGLAAILFGIFNLIENWSRLTGSLKSIFHLHALVMVIPVIFMVITIHELSHGLTCCHFGGKVHELGFMLIYFQPAFFCDVSDAWLFPSRRSRMWVTFAGGYAQFILWGFCSVIWWATNTDTWIHQMTTVVLVYSGITSLMNFNPLIKMDGYYLLSDYLEIPNLRAKAVKAVWDRVAGRPWRAGASRRERRIHLIYGAGAILFSTVFLLYVYSHLFRWVTARYEFAGLIGFAMFSTVTLRKTAAETFSGFRALAARASIKKFRNLGIAAAITLISIFGRWELKIGAKFSVTATNEREAFAETEGIVYEVRVKEGSVVRDGEVLARMRDPEKERRIQDYDTQILEKQTYLDLLREGNRAQAIETKKRQIETKETEIRNATLNEAERARLDKTLIRLAADLVFLNSELKRQRELLVQELVSRDKVDRALHDVQTKESEIAEKKEDIRMIDERERALVAQKQAELRELQSELKDLETGSRPLELRREEAGIAGLVRLRQLLKDELAKMEIKAPIDGVVATPDVEKKRNTHLEVGEPFCLIVDRHEIRAEMLVPEKEVADVEIGDQVWMKLDGYTSEDIPGRVDFISDVVKTTPEGERVIVVRSLIDSNNTRLRTGLGGSAKIYAGERRIIEIVTRRLVRWIKTELLPIMP
jgi:multidrug resistance efflux pump